MAKKKPRPSKPKPPVQTNKKGATAETKKRLTKRGACGHG